MDDGKSKEKFYNCNYIQVQFEAKNIICIAKFLCKLMLFDFGLQPDLNTQFV